MDTISIKLKPGNDLLKELEDIASKQNQSGYILGVVGNVSVARFQCPEQKKATVLEENLEIITLNGTISPNGCHLHLSISDNNCKVWGGHLEKGTKILKEAQILIGLSENSVPINLYKEIEIYTLPNCPWSSRAIRLLRTLQIPHKIKTVNNQIDFEAVNKKSHSSTFPQIFIDDEFIGGYTELADLNSSGKL